MWGQNFLQIFAKSPIKPIQAHMGHIENCVTELKPFFGAVMQHDWDSANARLQEILRLEREADTVYKEIRLHLPSSLFMPFARTDLLALLKMQDKIASKAKHIAGLVLTRRMVFPKQMGELFTQFVDKCIDACRQANCAINELEELLDAGFRGREVQLVEDMIEQLDKLERDTDEIQVELRKALFEIEKDLPPVDVIFLYKVIDWTGELADRAQYVGQRLESLVAQ